MDFSGVEARTKLVQPNRFVRASTQAAFCLKLFHRQHDIRAVDDVS